jgi:hypothetical protein
MNLTKYISKNKDVYKVDIKIRDLMSRVRKIIVDNFFEKINYKKN